MRSYWFTLQKKDNINKGDWTFSFETKASTPMSTVVTSRFQVASASTSSCSHSPCSGEMVKLLVAVIQS
jgi:hypothetical protein